jgi:hypothetical protein
MLTTEFRVLAGDSDPVDQGDEGDWETVGEPAERNRSPVPTVEELVLQLTQRSTTVVEPQSPVVETGRNRLRLLLLKNRR